MNPTRDTVDYIKGLGLVIITWHHLIYNNLPGYFPLLGNQFVSFYFIVSGYGIYYSLENTLHGTLGRDVLAFYTRRCIRIFPMYWLWFAFGYPFGHRPVLLDFFLLSLDHPPMWFLNAIFHCYLVAPLLYVFIKRRGLASLWYFVLVLAAVNVACHQLGVPHRLAYAYMKVFFLHIFFFACGMLLPGLMDKRLPLRRPGAVLAALLAVFVFAALQITRHAFKPLALPAVEFLGMTVNPYVALLTLTAVVMSLILLQHNPILPLRNAFMLIGTYSLPAYLLNDYYGNYIVYALGKGRNLFAYFTVFVLFFPVLLCLCICFQKLVSFDFTARTRPPWPEYRTSVPAACTAGPGPKPGQPTLKPDENPGICGCWYLETSLRHWGDQMTEPTLAALIPPRTPPPCPGRSSQAITFGLNTVFH